MRLNLFRARPLDLDKPCRVCHITPRWFMLNREKCLICMRSRAFEQRHGITHTDAEYRYVWRTYALRHEHARADQHATITRAFR